MTEVLAIRPFVPARAMAESQAFYEALGFRATHADAQVTILKLGSFSFILQAFDAPGLSDNTMVQMLVRDVDAWWQRVDGPALVERFDVKPPRAPAMQSWGLRVGFLFDPAGVLWQVAAAPF